MKIDGPLGDSYEGLELRARELEAKGYDGATSTETAHDPFLPLVLAARCTERLELATGVAIAFARTPLTAASTANDLQLASRGRFSLALGSQVKPHIERRFSMPWARPAARMREFVLAMRAIWAAWNEGERLDFQGDFYTHTLMPPFFNPGPNPFGAPPVLVAAVGDKMTQVAGEVADGIVLHPFTTQRYVNEVTLPALERGFATSDRTRADFTVSAPVFVVTGTTDAEWERARAGTQQQIAFYGSTPGYRNVLRVHGWEDVGIELTELSRRGDTAAMTSLISDEMLDTFAVSAEPEELGHAVAARYDGVLDRFSFDAPYESDAGTWTAAVAGFRAAER